MHDMLDTEDADGASERYWPETFKETIRTHLAATFAQGLQAAETFKTIYGRHYAQRFGTYQEFAGRLAEMATIGAENGADLMFDDIHTAFRKDAPFPRPRAYARYYAPEPFDDAARSDLHQKIVDEYRNTHAYVHVFEDHYQGGMDFDEFMDQVAGLVVLGAVNGADDMLGRIYRAFLTASPLPPARRRPKRLR